MSSHTVQGTVGRDAHDAAQSCIICADTVKKVWISAKSVTILADHLLKPLVLVKLVLPLVVIIVRFCVLQLIQ